MQRCCRRRFCSVIAMKVVTIGAVIAGEGEVRGARWRSRRRRAITRCASRREFAALVRHIFPVHDGGAGMSLIPAIGDCAGLPAIRSTGTVASTPDRLRAVVAIIDCATRESDGAAWRRQGWLSGGSGAALPFSIRACATGRQSVCKRYQDTRKRAADARVQDGDVGVGGFGGDARA